MPIRPYFSMMMMIMMMMMMKFIVRLITFNALCDSAFGSHAHKKSQQRNRACKLLKFVSMVSMFLTISGGKQNNCCNGA